MEYMDTTETGGTPVEAALGTVNILDTATAEPGTASISAPATSDTEVAIPGTELSEQTDKEGQLRIEMSLVSSAVLNIKTQETVVHLATLDVEDKKAFLEANPHARILVEVDFLRKLSAERLTASPIHLDQSDPQYTHNDQILGSITAINGDEFTCSISGSTETVTMTRDQLIAIAIGANTENVLANFPEESAERTLINAYFETSAPGAKMTEQQISELPNLITEVAKAHNIPTTDTIIKAAEDYYKEQVPPEGASAEELQRITEENEQSKQLLEKIKTQYKDQNLASATELDQILELRGLNKAGLGRKLDTLRANISTLQTKIKDAKTPEEKNRLKLQLDAEQATIQVYQDIHKQLTDSTTKDYLDKLYAGHVPAELGAQIINAIETGDMSALLLMVSPEADINATAEQKTKARVAREKFDKNVRTIGVIAALAALLLALGISQGAKQQ